MKNVKYRIAKNITLRKEFFGGLIFEQRSGTIMEVNQTAMKIIDGLISCRDPVYAIKNQFPNIPVTRLWNDSQEFIKALIDKQIISYDGDGRYIRNVWDTKELCLTAPRSVFWECTDNCNIRTCIHCYKSGHDSWQKDIQNCNFMKQLAQAGVFTVDIGGGEPLMRKDISSYINMANDYGMRCNIATNLTVDKSVVTSFLGNLQQKHLNALQISLDGHNSVLHDLIRGGDGWFKKMVENLTVLSKNQIKIHFNVTVMKINIEYLEDIVKTAINLHASSIRFVRIIPSCNGSDASLLLNSNEYKYLSNRLVELHDKYKTDIEVKTDDSFLFLTYPQSKIEQMKSRIPWLKPPYVGCGAARTLLGITAQGIVLPCVYLRDKRFHAGSVTGQSINDIWRSSDVFWRLRYQTSLGPRCDVCNFKSICLGGCRAAAYAFNSRENSTDPACWKLQ